MDWMSLNICSWSATSVSRILPSQASIFKVLQILVGSSPSFFNRVFNTLQYRLGSALSVIIPTTSTTEKYHFSSLSSHRVSSWLNLNTLFCFVFRIFKQVFHFFNECFCLWVKFIKHFLVTIYKSIIVTAMSFLKKCCKYLAC